MSETERHELLLALDALANFMGYLANCVEGLGERDARRLGSYLDDYDRAAKALAEGGGE